MNHLVPILVQFLFRLTFGVALATGLTPPRLVSSGFFRVQLWVLMGLDTFATLALYSGRQAFIDSGVSPGVVLGLGIAGAVTSYFGAAFWLYEKAAIGRTALGLVGLIALLAAALATPWQAATSAVGLSLAFLDLVSSGVLLGVTLAAMLLGHWYLNTPGMQLLPLRRLVKLMVAAIVVRTLLCAIGLWLTSTGPQPLDTAFWIWLAFRWLSGLLGTLAMAWLAWETLRIPNTQSATGILYAGVILAFMGELVAALLNVGRLYPV